MNNYGNRNQSWKSDRPRDFQAPQVTLPEFNAEWITNRLSEDAISFSDQFGNYLHAGGRGLTTSQIRNYFGEVRRIQMHGIEKERTSFLLLKPKLAYLAKRANNKEILEFRKVMDKAHEAVNIEKAGAADRFKNYMDLLESILAYHKVYGGK